MNYGKNQQALLKFLQKHPNRWHMIKRRKAIAAAKGLEKRGIGIRAYASGICKGYVRYAIPQMGTYWSAGLGENKVQINIS